MKSKDRILILCIDRDDDIGRKASIAGPIIGREEAVKTATAMGIADPEDSDCNAIFKSIKLHDELKKEYPVQVAVLTGDQNVGLKSDKKIAEQLETVMRTFTADYVVMVSDGSEDEQIMPIIQNRLPVMSVSRVIVHQAEQLESTYFKIKDFVKESLDNPKYSRVVFGLPAIVLLLFGLFGAEGARFIVGALGLYLFIKGFKLEDLVLQGFEELRRALSTKRFAFFSYVIGLVFTGVGAFQGIAQLNIYLSRGVFEALAGFLSVSVPFFFFAGTAGWIGINISRGIEDRRKLVAVPVFGLAVTIVLVGASRMILGPETPLSTFIGSIGVGFALLFVALLIEWKR